MKAKGIYILIFLLMISLCANLKVFSSSGEDFEYAENADGGLTIVKYTGKSSIVNIPSQINGMKVTRIGRYAFVTKSVAEITIPDTVTHIGFRAFWTKGSLKSITFPDSVKVIEDEAFASCYELESVKFGAFIEYIGKDAFAETPFLEETFKGYDSIGIYSNGAFIATKDKKLGLIDLNQNVLLPFEYELILPCENKHFEVKKDGRWFYLDSSLQPVIINYQADMYQDLKLHLEISEISLEEKAKKTETEFHSTYGISGRKKDLIDYKGNLNIVYEAADSENIYIARFDENYRVTDTVKITRELPLFGTAVCDDKGNYYILYGANVEENEKESENVVIVKYDYSGKKLGKASYIAGEMSVSGTKEPFAFGSASMAISKNVIAAHFARKMFRSYDGLNHQCSAVVFADINTMLPVSGPLLYIGHSFDQYIMPASEDGFILEDRGDAYPRAFVLSRVSSGESSTFESFHFSETTTYQYTLSELGGLAESTVGYVLAASSVNKLTYTPIDVQDTIPRNVFIQVIKKNFMDHDNTEDKLVSKGATRVPDGRPGTTGLNRNGQSYFLPENVADYGVVWLTGYSGDESATNPKIVKLEQDAFAVLWEKFKNEKPVGTYYAIIDGTGKIIKEPTLIPNAKLTTDRPPLFIRGEIVWSVIGEDPQKISVYRLMPGSSEYTILKTGESQTYFLPQNAPGTKYILSQWAVDGVKRAMEVNLPQNQLLSDFQKNITREEFCEMAVRLYDLLSGEKAELPSTNVFKDTSNPSVLKAHALGIIKGVGEGRFAPEERITRQEIAVMYERLLNALKINPAVTSEYKAFADEEEIAPWAKSAVQLLNKLNIITGVGGNKVAPLGSVTREQAIIMSIRLFDLYGN